MPSVALAFTLAIVIGVAGCGGAPVVPFDPTGPCTVDGSAPGAYPDLEAAVPIAYESRPPDALDSGRHCSPENLGSLATLGIDEVRFAGGTWDFGSERAADLVVFHATGLTAKALADFYAGSALDANRTQVLGSSTPAPAGRPGFRLDTKTGGRLQTVVVWPAIEPDTVNVIITNDLPDPKIEAAVDAFDGR
jgi:hypothetical protein